MRAPRLGGFLLDRVLGRGGMAEVWLGHHRLTDAPAAIKVVTRESAHTPAFRDGLRREVRAVAGLDHPGIIAVLDAGVVPASAAPAGLEPGSPWLAMVVAEHGDLGRLPTPMPWPLLRDVLLQILDALAHAHARGVIHRDLKPENVLLQLDPHPRLMLTDFGIAHVVAPEGLAADAAGVSAGTPHYMAPEQLRGRWRTFGPWTDLYALGCVAFELACGAPPYSGRTPLEVATKHVVGPIPHLGEALPLPPGFVAWVRRLMERDPRARFATAADAAFALGALPDPGRVAERRAWAGVLTTIGAPAAAAPTRADGPAASVGGLAAYGTLCVLDRRALGAATTAPGVVAGDGPELDPAEPAPVLRPPIPPTWYADLPRRPLLPGVGLGLFGVRALPFVGRDGARNALWDALRRIAAGGAAELVLIEGEEGLGKTALAEWFLHRAQELGAADVMRFTFGETEGRGDAVAAGLRSWFRGQGLDRAQLIDRVSAELGWRAPGEQPVIEAVLAPSLARIIERTVDDVALSLSERHTAERDLLRIVAGPRPLVVLYDDAGGCAETRRFVRWLFDHALPARVLLVATARPGSALKGLAAERGLTIGLDPLGPRAHAALVEDLLGLDRVLSDLLRQRTRGNPLFAVQTVAEWVESGALKPGPGGYTTRRDVPLPIPSSLEALAERRIGRLVDAAPDPAMARRALAVGAMLGDAVHDGEWRAACETLDLRPPDDLLDTLHDAGLTRPGRDGWLFGHGFTRRALLAGVPDADRAALHRACAGAVRSGHIPAARRARHLVAAGDLYAAIDALTTAAGERMAAAEYDEALATCARRDALIERVGLPADDVRRVRTLPTEVGALRYSGRTAAAVQAARRFEAAPIDGRHLDLLAERARMRGARAVFLGESADLGDAYEEAVALYRQAGDDRGVARALHGLSWGRLRQGRFDDALAVLERSRRLAAGGGWTVDEGWAWQSIAAARLFGDRPSVEPAIDEAERCFTAIRLPSGVGLVRVERADLALVRGDVETARRHAAAAIEIFTANGSHMVMRAQVSLALAELLGGSAEDAHRRICAVVDDGALQRAAREHHYGAQALVAWTALRVGQTARIEPAIAAVEADPARGFMHPIARRGLSVLAEGLSTGGSVELARRVWRLAADYWRPIDPARSARCAAKVAG